MNKKDKQKIPNFFADTCWYAMTKRMKEEMFESYIQKRKKQGFTAIQISIGIPPEVNTKNKDAESEKGIAWEENGKINFEYLEFCKERIKKINKIGLIAIIYGAWGNQIEWIGKNNMLKWWNAIIDNFDSLNVIYCLTGEIDIYTHNKIDMICRINKWKYILKKLNKKTKKPILVHTMPGNSSYYLIKNKNLLSANTFQTGHEEKSKENLWKKIYISKIKYPKEMAINLEPYYEGINNKFYLESQITSFWLSVASGADAICYGAQGIWNIGDGKFLSHWGKQSFQDAIMLDTPNILVKAYKRLIDNNVFEWNIINANFCNGQLIQISRKSKEGNCLTYIPEIKKAINIPEGKYYDIYKNEFCKELPKMGEAIVFKVP